MRCFGIYLKQKAKKQRAKKQLALQNEPQLNALLRLKKELIKEEKQQQRLNRYISNNISVI